MKGENGAASPGMVRAAEPAEIERLARIWWLGWRDAHAAIIPPELARLRTQESFRRRMSEDLENVRVAGLEGCPLGFVMLKGDELYQFYVTQEARGTGVAGALMADSIDRLRATGLQRAWLACAIGNARAARFYEKWGWRNVGTMLSELPTEDGVFTLEVWRFERDLWDEGSEVAVTQK